MKMNHKLIFILIFVILTFIAGILIWHISTTQNESSDFIKVNTLNVTYWNPWGGLMHTDEDMPVNIDIDYPAFTLSDYVRDSAIIVSVNVTETVEWTDSDEEGKIKLQELNSPWVSSYGKECFMNVDEVLKGNFEIDQIYLKTDMKNSEFTVQGEYILFLVSESNNSGYQIRPPIGYLVKNGSDYQFSLNGEDETGSITKIYLTYLILISQI